MSRRNGGIMADITKPRDRLTELRVQGMRALEDVRLPLDGLTVLIGDNGTGKSSLVEAIEVLRRVPELWSIVGDVLVPFHGGLASLLRAGAKTLRLGVSIEGGGPRIDYSFGLTSQGGFTVISEEHLDVWQDPGASEPLHVIDRNFAECRTSNAALKGVSIVVGGGELALRVVLRDYGTKDWPDAARVMEALGRASVHVPFDVEPSWIRGNPARLREPAIVDKTLGLDRLGGNLANAYHALSTGRSKDVWQRTLERVRGGLGSDLIDVQTPPAGPGLIQLGLDFRGLPQRIPGNALSDGQLAYLAFVALAELGRNASVLAFDEPETHLHPELLVRVVWLLEELAQSCPVLLSTHSDRLLDALSEPAKSVVLCELDEHRAARLYRPAPEALGKWLARYRGLGALRAEGYGPHVLTEPMGTR
jgi:predicted ATPase